MPHETDDRTRAEALGAYLKSLRTGLEMTLRDVEEATEKEVSNAYLSQLENGKIVKPSPHILHSLATAYRVPYPKLMERAGYLSPAQERPQGAKHGRAATRSVDNLTPDEEKELLKYLAYVRSTRKKS
jgi:transcriptional regulator with XRE-family HTH domain